MTLRNATRLILLLLLIPLLQCPSLAAEPLPATSLEPLPKKEVLRQWVEQIKRNQRGPFKRLRWFCNDGAILPPKAYACSEHGGGVQHGQWTEQVLLLLLAVYLYSIWLLGF